MGYFLKNPTINGTRHVITRQGKAHLAAKLYRLKNPTAKGWKRYWPNSGTVRINPPTARGQGRVFLKPSNGNKGAIVGTATLTTTNTDGSTSTSNHAVLLVPMDLVTETTPGSGTYDHLDGAPVFPADNGVGRGPSPNASSPKGMFITLASDLTTTAADTMTASIGGPSGYFSGTLTETSANSGVFQNSANTVTVTLPVGTTTSSTAIDTLNVVVNSTSLGYTNANFSMVESAVDSLNFGSPIQSAEIIFSSAYNPSVVNTITANLQVEFTNGFYGVTPIDPVSVTMTETSAGSETFVDATSGLTVSLTNFTGTNAGSVDSAVATFSGGLLGSSAETTTLTETTATSMDFTAYTTTGDSSNGQGSDVTPDNPTSTGDGIFHIRVKGMSGPFTLGVQSDIGAMQEVTLTASSTDPDTLISGKLLLVPQSATGTTTYSGVQTLTTASSSGLISDISDGVQKLASMFHTYSTTTSGGTTSWVYSSAFPHIGGIFLIQCFPQLDMANVQQNLPGYYYQLSANLDIVRNLANPNLSLHGCQVWDYSPTSKYDLLNAIPYFRVMYINCHGITLPPGDVVADTAHAPEIPFQGIQIGSNIYPSDISTVNVDSQSRPHAYDLVFINGCGSAELTDPVSATITGDDHLSHTYHSAATTMAQSFHCRAYIGWTNTADVAKTGVASQVFFTQLTGQTQVRTAIDNTNNDSGVSYFNSVIMIGAVANGPDPSRLQDIQFSDANIGGTPDSTNWTATNLMKH